MVNGGTCALSAMPAGNLTIGAVNGEIWNRNVDGRLDEVELYHVALSAGRVRARWEGAVCTTPTPTRTPTATRTRTRTPTPPGGPGAADVLHYHLDHLGSTQAITTSTGGVYRHIRYKPYGEVRGGSTCGADQLCREFTGYDTEPISALEYAGARVYDPALAMFLTHDPARQFHNPYAYAAWNPMTFTDPTGTIVTEEYTVTAPRWDPPGMTVISGAAWQAADLGLGSVPYISTGIDVCTACTGTNPVTGEQVGWAGRGIAVVGALTPTSGGEIRTVGKLLKKILGVAEKAGANIFKGKGEIVQRAMSRAELAATKETGLLRGGREGTHYVSDAVNSDPLKARQRLALPDTPEVRVTMEVPEGVLSSPSRVAPNSGMSGGGMERTAIGDVPVRIIAVDEY